tara:strand:- start:1796 stop:2527 length:732 start_codon:yes stop_codon:yes gene_type:complete
MQLKADTIALQKELANYTRTGKSDRLGTLNPDRLKHYRRLVYNVAQGIIDQAFPITKSSVDPDLWNELKLQFHEHYACREAEVWKMPKEFMNYTSENEIELKNQFPFLMDLLEFEWLEIEIQNQMNDSDFESRLKNGETDMINPYHQLSIFDYPIHKLNAKEALNHPGKYYLLTYRKYSDFQVRYMEFTPFTAVLFEQFKQNQPHFDVALVDTCHLFNTELTDPIKSEKEHFIARLKEKEILV